MKRLTHTEYLYKLKEKNINVVPNEDYVSSQIPILHKCVCGNTWCVSPGSVLLGKQCGCGRKRLRGNTEWYIKKLESKCIDILPKEPYAGATTKILHKCVCGTEYSATPTSVFRGTKCKKCRKYDGVRDKQFFYNKQTTLYFIAVNDVFKIGITTKSDVLIRFKKDIKTGVKITVLYEERFSNGADAYDKEQSILKRFANIKYIGEPLLHSGNSELLTENIIDYL